MKAFLLFVCVLSLLSAWVSGFIVRSSSVLSRRQQFLSASRSYPSYQPNIKDLLIADSCSGLTRSEINEYVLELEKRNPTYEPAYSPLLNGVWEIVSASVLSPGMLGFKVMKNIPSAIVDASDLTITISSVAPRVKASTNVKIATASVEVSVTTDIQALSGVRLQERYESGKLGPIELPLNAVTTLKRELLVSYLDKDLLIVRDVLGSPEILRRREMPSRAETGDNINEGSPAV
eukprot:gene28841-34809_t